MQNENTCKVFYSNIKKRCEKLIEYNIWNGIDILDFRSWLKNFDTEEERFFSAIILNSLIYRSEEHVLSMLFDLLTRDLHNAWRLNHDDLYNEDNNPYDLLQSKYGEIGFRMVAAVKEKDPPSKSGFHMTFLLNHSMNIINKWTITPNLIAEDYREHGIRCFVLLDDISCTGEQMASVLDEINLKLYPDARFYVVLCTIHEKGYAKIMKDYPQVKIVYNEWLDNSNNFFEMILLTETNYQDIDSVKLAYKEFLSKKQIKYKPPYGKGDLALTYAFSHNVPNNSLPILFYDGESFSKLLIKRA